MTRSTRTRRLPRISAPLIALGLAILGPQFSWAEEANQSCDCSCGGYSWLIENSSQRSARTKSPAVHSETVQEELLACAGACAIAWVRCDAQLATNTADTDSGTGSEIKRSASLTEPDSAFD